MRGRTSLAPAWRGRAKRWQIAQCAVAAGVAWLIAADLLGHPRRSSRRSRRCVSLGTSYGQRLRRVAEVTVGVALGVFLADLLVDHHRLGRVAAHAGRDAVDDDRAADRQRADVRHPGGGAVDHHLRAGARPRTPRLVRWSDAVVGGCVALVAATVVPAAPLRRPREQAASVVRKISALLRAAGEVMVDGDVDPCVELLADARATDNLIRELQDAADEGMAVVSSSPFRVRHRPDIRRMADLVEPLDRALRSTRVLVRQTAVAAYHHRHVPKSYSLLALDLADAADMVAEELAADRMAVAAARRCSRWARRPGWSSAPTS